MMKHIAIFASGQGSNADNICTYFKNHISIKVSLIVCDRKEAGVFKVAEKHNITSIYINKQGWQDLTQLQSALKDHQIDFIVLAGFLKLVPLQLIKDFPSKIINIHPALLPKFGGHGMYGKHVHQAVFESGESETGITIHYVDEHYDNGDVIFQATASLNKGDNPEVIAARIHQLEMKHFPTVIEKLLATSN